MNLELSGDQQLYLDATRRLLDRECEIATVRELAETKDGFRHDWWRQGADLGWAAMLVSEEHGGAGSAGGGLRDLVMVARGR